MDFEVTWMRQAAADLEEIIAFVANQNPTAAEDLRLDILGHVKILQRFPSLGPVYRPDRRGGTRQIACRSYRVFYRVLDLSRRVEILTIRHGSPAEPDLRN